MTPHPGHPPSGNAISPCDCGIARGSSTSIYSLSSMVDGPDRLDGIAATSTPFFVTFLLFLALSCVFLSLYFYYIILLFFLSRLARVEETGGHAILLGGTQARDPVSRVPAETLAYGASRRQHALAGGVAFATATVADTTPVRRPSADRRHVTQLMASVTLEGASR